LSYWPTPQPVPTKTTSSPCASREPCHADRILPSPSVPTSSAYPSSLYNYDDCTWCRPKSQALWAFHPLSLKSRPHPYRMRSRFNLKFVNYSIILVTVPAPTVLPPSRIAKRIFSSIATGTIICTSILTLSPGITISTPSGRVMSPVTSVVRI